MSGSALNSSSGVFFVVSIHFSISTFKFSFNKFDDDIDDFFFPIKVVISIPRLSDLFDSSNFLFLKLTVSEIELPTFTLASVAPSFFASSRQ